MRNKTCKKCESVKDISEFYKHKNSKDGHSNECKVCVKARAVEWNRNNKDKKREAGRKWARENAERSREIQRNYYNSNKEKIDTRYADWKSKNADKVSSYKEKWANNNKDKIERYRLENKEHLSEMQKDWTKNNRQQVNENNAKWKKANPKKVKAHNLVSNSLRDGKLQKPLSCECCGVFTDALHAHHCDYNKPLDVNWLCHICHADWHKHNTPIV